MVHVSFRFYAELNDLLPKHLRFSRFACELERATSMGDVIESLGVPLAEVDLVLVAGQPVSLSHCLEGGEDVAVYPVFESFDVSGVQCIRPQPLRVTRFVLDASLGELACSLHRLGLDVVEGEGAEELGRISREQRRIVLTRDPTVLGRDDITHGYCVEATEPREQLAEVMQRFHLTA